MYTYISLFSSAGVGCYGFKDEGFECIATNELIERRINIQKFNDKCKYSSGYINGDITDKEVKLRLLGEVELWKKKEKLSKVDVIVATPPCQGMSVANHKKTVTEIKRNSLVVESIKIINEIKPKIFIFENVPAFLKTVCTDVDGVDKAISEAMKNNLGKDYVYTSKIINFKNYGASSSRQRTLVIGVLNEYSNEFSPYELFPEVLPEKSLRETIGALKPLKTFGEIDKVDIYHSFRTYPEHMREWIKDLKEGESAFDNENIHKKPHQVIDGEIVVNKQKNGDKYKRQYWDKVGPCVHTRNDLLASQNTVHPVDDRVFSIRELMLMMTVPSGFKWIAEDIDTVNTLSEEIKRKLLKKEEIKIRQSLGEAVPTIIFKNIAKNIKRCMSYNVTSNSKINKIVSENDFDDIDKLINFIEENPFELSLSALSRIAELSNTKRTDNAAFFTSKPLITEMMNSLPEINKDTVHILEPSVGVGNFIPLIFKKFENKEVYIDVIDINNDSLRVLKALIKKYDFKNRYYINYINDDFLTHEFNKKYDLIIGNPPFFKVNGNNKLLDNYRKNCINKKTTNICSFFLDKIQTISEYYAVVFPKFLLNTPEFASSRDYLSNKNVDCIIDFGEKGFPGVLVETIALFVNNKAKPSKTKIISVTNNTEQIQNQEYIFDKSLPYWIIYRNEIFDNIYNKLEFDVFNVFRDRQITNKILSNKGEVRVLKSRNISDDGKEILNLGDYDSYSDYDDIEKLSVFKYLNETNVYLTPNMTYKPRVIKKPDGIIVNGSIAILIPKDGILPTKEQLEYFSTNEYREFYRIARNYQTRSLNVDTCSVYFYGLLKK